MEVLLSINPVCSSDKINSKTAVLIHCIGIYSGEEDLWSVSSDVEPMGTGVAPNILRNGWTYEAVYASNSSSYTPQNTNIGNYKTIEHRTTIPGIAIIFTTIVAIIIGIPVIIIRLRKAPLYSEAIDWIVGHNAMDPNAADYNYSSISTENTAAK